MEAINRFLVDTNNSIVNAVLGVVSKYGTPEEINAKAQEARKLPNLLRRLRDMESPYLKDLEWLLIWHVLTGNAELPVWIELRL